MVELHGKRRSAFCHAPQVGNVTEHFLQGNQRPDDDRRPRAFLVLDLPAAAIEVAHDVDSSALAFEIAAKACFREGMKKASPIILEPIMDVEVTTPQDHVGDVVGDLNRRRGQIQNQESSGSTVIVRAHVPLKEMFGYISHLRSMTKGRASFTMQFHHYDPVPRNIADEIMAKSA